MYLHPEAKGRTAQNHCVTHFQREKRCLKVQGERAMQDFFQGDLQKPAQKQELSLKAFSPANWFALFSLKFYSES